MALAAPLTEQINVHMHLRAMMHSRDDPLQLQLAHLKQPSRVPGLAKGSIPR
jgi:hypothetical protein